jgi:protein-disulfide isomerase
MISRTKVAAAAFAVLAAGAAGFAIGNSGVTTPALAAEMSTPVTSFSTEQRGDIETIVRSYLMEHPEVIRDAINELQRREDEAARVAQTRAIDDSANLIFSSDKQVVIGNPDGKVTLVEFFDYNCTYCRRAQADMVKLLKDDPNLRVVLKEFPVLGPGSVDAAKVSVAVRMVAPEKYLAFHDALLSEPGKVDGARALAVAEDLGIDTAALQANIESDEVKATIAESYSLADKLNLTGTPSYVTHNEVVVGAVGFDTLKQKVADARESCKTATC